jgi:hypothetical protein
MSNNITNFDLFPTCVQYWDEDEKVFRNGDSVEVAECCIKNCDNTYDYCIERCAEKYKDNKQYKIECGNKCINLNKNLCRSYCQLASTNLQPGNVFYKCAEDFGCNTISRSFKHLYSNKEGFFTDKECVNKNKDDIFNCCMNNCDPQENDCKKYCNFFLNSEYIDTPLVYSRQKEDNKLQSTVQNTKSLQNTKSEKKSNLLYVLFITCLIFLAGGAIFLFIFYKILFKRK